jgi:hypothetical protein
MASNMNASRTRCHEQKRLEKSLLGRPASSAHSAFPAEPLETGDRGSRHDYRHTLDLLHRNEIGRMTTEGKIWQPTEHAVDYIDRIITAICVLWPDDAEKLEIVRQVVEHKLNRWWQFEHKRMPEGHKPICAGVLWDRLVTRYPGHDVYRVMAIWDETLNPANDAKKVALIVQPVNKVELVQINLEA